MFYYRVVKINTYSDNTQTITGRQGRHSKYSSYGCFFLIGILVEPGLLKPKIIDDYHTFLPNVLKKRISTES